MMYDNKVRVPVPNPYASDVRQEDETKQTRHQKYGKELKKNRDK